MARRKRQVHHVKIISGRVTSIEQICNYEGEDYKDVNCELFSYGNTLYITFKKSDAVVCEYIYQWMEGRYVSYNFDAIIAPSVSNIDYDYYQTSSNISAVPSISVTAYMGAPAADFVTTGVVTSYVYNYKMHLERMTKLNYIHGTVYLMYAYRLTDGTIIKNSAIHMLESQKLIDINLKPLAYSRQEDILFFYLSMWGIIPTLHFNVPQSIIDNPLIDSIVVYSSRNNLHYDLENLHEKVDFDDNSKENFVNYGNNFTRMSARSIIDKTYADVARAPFYEIAELDFRKDMKLELNYREHYENIESQPIFKPNLTHHIMTGLKKYEYNSRLHLIGVKTLFYRGEIILNNSDILVADATLFFEKIGRTGLLIFVTTLEDNYNTLVSYQEKRCKLYKEVESNTEYVILQNMISYPDVRAKSIEVYCLINGESLFYLKKIKLIKFPENGCSYYHNLEFDPVSGNNAYPLKNIVSRAFNKDMCEVIYTNKIAVSELNNGYVFSYENILNIDDSSTIINGVETIYHNFAENSFGLYPLYVFTSRGIFALESKDNTVVYSNIVPVNEQITDSGFSSVSACGVLFFISYKGLYSIVGTTIKHMSNSVDEVVFSGLRFMDYLHEAKLHYGVHYQELMIYNSKYDYCYLYSIATEQFTTRDYNYVQISYDRLINDSGIYSLRSPEMKFEPLNSYIESNASGMGVSKRKKISLFEVAGMFKQDGKLRLYGSNDLVKWIEIKSVDAYKSRIKKVLGSWKYLKFSIASSYIEIDTVEIVAAVREI